MIKTILFLLLKLYDLCAHPFVRKSKTQVVFHHPDHPHLMREIYTREKENPEGSFYVEAAPEKNDWNEYIRMGKSWLHNYYHLDVKENHWQGSPTWRTFTTAFVASFHLDFMAEDRTVLTLHAKPSVTDAGGFQSWFQYCLNEGVQKVVVNNEGAED